MRCLRTKVLWNVPVFVAIMSKEKEREKPFYLGISSLMDTTMEKWSGNDNGKYLPLFKLSKKVRHSNMTKKRKLFVANYTLKTKLLIHKLINCYSGTW